MSSNKNDIEQDFSPLFYYKIKEKTGGLKNIFLIF